jgi:large subunit ribosomal protein L18
MNAKVLKTKLKLRAQRKKRIRGKISGDENKLRISIFKSNKYISAQAIDDTTGKTLVSVNGKTLGLSTNIESAKKVGAEFAARLKTAGHTTVVFDRNGYLYHGAIKAFADALRENEISL